MTFQDRIPLYVGAFGAILVAVCFMVSASVGIGALAGAGVALVNAFAMRWLVSAAIKSDPAKRASVSLLLMTKTGLILGLSAIALCFGRVDPIGFALGIGALVLGLVVGASHYQISREGNQQTCTQPVSSGEMKGD